MRVGFLETSACLAVLLSSSLAAAQWQRNGKQWPDSAWSKSESGFSAMLLMSDNPDEVVRDWETPDAPVTVRAVNTITRGVPIVGFVVFAGCEPDERGNCNASVDFIVLKPDGSEYVNFPDRDLWRGKPAPPKDTLRLAAEYVGVIIEPDDPLGEYEVRASIHDRNADAHLELRRTFTATAR
ncbi:MAG TPA: hypothetical protein VD788_02320 [Candidatus Polarisedimenticolaceae bacterium]|nr:hypothetical protein [Candidatus Polarisedimenticolaceae bacterium]